MTQQQDGADGLGRGDDVYQPDEDGDREIREDTGPLEPEDTLDDRGVDEVLDEGYSPPERPLAVEDTGTTGGEQRSGESLDDRLARERPERRPPLGDGLGDASDTDGELLDPEAGGLRSGRLVGPDEGAHPRRDGVSGDDVGIDGGAATAEEAAVHVVEDEDLPALDDDEHPSVEDADADAAAAADAAADADERADGDRG
jgi:hypothetical protein